MSSNANKERLGERSQLLIFPLCYTLTTHVRRFKTFLCEVHIFWEGHKILRNLHLTFDWLYSLHRTKVRWRFRKISWPSQNIWTLCRNLTGDKQEVQIHLWIYRLIIVLDYGKRYTLLPLSFIQIVHNSGRLFWWNWPKKMGNKSPTVHCEICCSGPYRRPTGN